MGMKVLKHLLVSFIGALLAQASVAHGFDFSALLDNTYLL